MAAYVEPYFSCSLRISFLSRSAQLGRWRQRAHFSRGSPCHTARSFGIAGKHSGNKEGKRFRALPHAAMLAIHAAGFRVEHIKQGFDFGLPGKP